MRARALAGSAVVVVTCALGSMACSAELGGGEGARRSWTLVAAPDLALVDKRCLGGDCPRYPNPRECDRLELSVYRDGKLCGRCVTGTETVEQCGGLLEGLPYKCALEVRSGAACAICEDLFGRIVHDDCGDSSLTATSSTGLRSSGDEEWSTEPGGLPDDGTARCFSAYKADGTPCSICLDSSSRIATNTCTVDTSTPDSGGDTPTTPPTMSACPPDDTTAIQTGREEFARKLNEILVEARLPGDYAPSAVDSTVDSSRAELFRSRFYVTSACRYGDELTEYTERLARSGDGSGGDQWYRAGRPRCAFMIRTAGMRARSTRPCDCTRALDEGIGYEMAHASALMDDRYECIGSPVVLDLDGDGVASEHGRARFDLGALGRASGTAWIRPGDGLLALDRDRDGRIDSGTELFGEVTPSANGDLAGDGFAALRSLDTNGDGAITEADPAYRKLVVWQDDGDARTTRGELQSLRALGIARIDVGATPVSAVDAAGSVLGLWSRFVRDDGSSGAACDVFFSTSR